MQLHSFDSDPVYYAADKYFASFEFTWLGAALGRTITFTTEAITNTLPLMEVYDTYGAALGVTGTTQLAWQPTLSGCYCPSVSPLTTSHACADSAGHNLVARMSPVLAHLCSRRLQRVPHPAAGLLARGHSPLSLWRDPGRI